MSVKRWLKIKLNRARAHLAIVLRRPVVIHVRGLVGVYKTLQELGYDPLAAGNLAVEVYQEGSVFLKEGRGFLLVVFDRRREDGKIVLGKL